jgi:protein involved in sex pheromone biosynthesis
MVSLPDLIKETRFRVPTREFLFENGHWHGQVTMLGWLNPAQLHRLPGVQPSHMGVGWAQQKNNNNNKYAKKLFKYL